MDISKYDVHVTDHAFERADERGIHPDLIEKTLLHGKIRRFGKNYVKFTSKGKRTIICVCEIIGNGLKVLTIEEYKNEKMR